MLIVWTNGVVPNLSGLSVVLYTVESLENSETRFALRFNSESLDKEKGPAMNETRTRRDIEIPRVQRSSIN